MPITDPKTNNDLKPEPSPIGDIDVAKETAENMKPANEPRDDSKISAKTTGSKKKKKMIKMIKSGEVHILASYNNTIVTVTDQNGSVISWSSAGKCGFKGPKKATPYAAGMIVKDAIERAIKERGLKEVEVLVKGIGAGREAAVRAIQAGGLAVSSLRDVTPIPHNGCRPPKIRRV